MPYKSKAQAAKFHAMEARGEIDHETVKEWDGATKKKSGGFAKLPKHTGHDAKMGPASPIDEKYRHEMHGKAGSHETSHHKLGGARAKIDTGDPKEQ